MWEDLTRGSGYAAEVGVGVCVCSWVCTFVLSSFSSRTGATNCCRAVQVITRGSGYAAEVGVGVVLRVWVCVFKSCQVSTHALQL